MMKEPRAERVKTRLYKDIGMVNSAWWFRQIKLLLRNISCLPKGIDINKQQLQRLDSREDVAPDATTPTSRRSGTSRAIA